MAINKKGFPERLPAPLHCVRTQLEAVSRQTGKELLPNLNPTDTVSLVFWTHMAVVGYKNNPRRQRPLSLMPVAPVLCACTLQGCRYNHSSNCSLVCVTLSQFWVKTVYDTSRSLHLCFSNEVAWRIFSVGFHI